MAVSKIQSRTAVPTPNTQCQFHKTHFPNYELNLPVLMAATLHLFNTSNKNSETDMFLDCFLSTSVKINVITVKELWGLFHPFLKKKFQEVF